MQAMPPHMRGMAAAKGQSSTFYIVAHVGSCIRDCGGCHLDVADDAAGAIPIFGEDRRHLQHTDRGIIGTIPPRPGARGPEISDAFAVVADFSRPGYRNVFLTPGVGKGEADIRPPGDLLILVAGHIRQEIDCIFDWLRMRRHRPGAQAAGYLSGQHAKADLVDQLPNAGVFVGLGHGCLLFLIAKGWSG